MMALVGKSKAISEEYKSALADLTFNSKPLINVLTMLAEENCDFGQAIVQVICDRITKVVVDQKMPALYLLDSILKNVGGVYVEIISKFIVDVFCHTFESAADERKRMQLFKLRNTWTQYVPAKSLYDLDVRISKTDPNWPVVAPATFVKSSTSVAASPKVHINPKFLQKSDVPSSTYAAVDKNKEDVSKSSSSVAKQKLLEEERRVQGQLKLLQAEKLKRDRQQHELELRKQQVEREKVLAEQKRQLEILRKQQQTLIESKKEPRHARPVQPINTTLNRARSEDLNDPYKLKDAANSKDPRVSKLQEQATSSTEKTIGKQLPKTPTKSALSVVNKIMTNINVKKTKPSFISSKPISQRPTSFKNADNKRDRSKSPKTPVSQHDQRREEPSEAKSNNIDGIMNSMTKTFSPESALESKLSVKNSMTVKESKSYPRETSLTSTVITPVDEKYIDSSVSVPQTTAALQAAALATAGPPPLPPVPPLSTAFSQLSSRDMQIAAQAAAIATAMHQMQAGNSTNMAPQQSAELAAKLIQLVAAPSSTCAEVVSTNSTETKSIDSSKGVQAVRNMTGKRAIENEPSKSSSVNKDRERSPHRSNELRPSEVLSVKPDRNIRNSTTPERILQRGRSERKNSKDNSDEPPSKRSKDTIENQERSRKARARSPSRYYFRMEKKIETEKRVEHNENELRLERIRKNSEGDVHDEDQLNSKTNPNTKRYPQQSHEEIQTTKRDRKKEFRALKSKLLDIQRDQRDCIPGFNISVLNDMKYEMSQKFKKLEITKQQYYELFELVDIIQGADIQRNEVKRSYDGDRSELRNNPQNIRRGYPGDENHPDDERFGPHATRGRERPHLRDVPPHLRDGPPSHLLDMPPHLRDDHMRHSGPPRDRHLGDGPILHPRDGPILSRELHPPHQRGGPPFHPRDGPPHQRELRLPPPHMRDDMPPHHRRSPNPPHLRDGPAPQFRGDMPSHEIERFPQRFEDGRPFYNPRDRPLPPANFNPHTDVPLRPTNQDFPMHNRERFPNTNEPFKPLHLQDRHPRPAMGPFPPPRMSHPDVNQDIRHHIRHIPPGFNDNPVPADSSMDVNNLLGQLLAAGMLEKKVELEIPVIKLTLDELKKRHIGAINQLFQGMQCSSCGHRFPLESKVQYSEHLDWHFRQNRREKDGVQKVSNRSWYYDVQDWIEHTENIRDESGKVQSAFFEAERQQASDEEKGLSITEAKKRKLNEESSIPVFGGDGDGVCDVCMEDLEQYWDEELEEWRYKKAVRENGKTYHMSCFEDYVPFELVEATSMSASTPTTPITPQANTVEEVKVEPTLIPPKEIKTEQPVDGGEEGRSSIATIAILDNVVGNNDDVDEKDISEDTSLDMLSSDIDKEADSPVYPPVLGPATSLSDITDQVVDSVEETQELVSNVEMNNEVIKAEPDQNSILKPEPDVTKPQTNISETEAK